VDEAIVYTKPSFWRLIMEYFRIVPASLFGLWRVVFARKSNIGKGNVVMIVPGLMTSDLSTYILRRYLQKKGFTVYGWRLGYNLGRLETLPLLEDRLLALYKNHCQKINLVGLSMGGLFGRELAHKNPGQIEKLITLGSPFRNVLAPNNVRWVYDVLNQNSDVDSDLVKRIATPPPIQSVAVYSRYDGLVPWQACMETENSRQHKNIEVPCSHLSMTICPEVMVVLLKELIRE
jgi:pimeloyl-ACP methyl ester carboxylesterase